MRILDLTLISLLLAGCVVPVPHQRTHQLGVIGEVADESSRKRIAGAVVACKEGQLSCRTDFNGAFRLPPVRRWHGALLVSPALAYSLFPDLDAIDQTTVITVSAQGYRPVSIRIKEESIDPSYLSAGIILMKPTESPNKARHDNPYQPVSFDDSQ